MYVQWRTRRHFLKASPKNQHRFEDVQSPPLGSPHFLGLSTKRHSHHLSGLAQFRCKVHRSPPPASHGPSPLEPPCRRNLRAWGEPIHQRLGTLFPCRLSFPKNERVALVRRAAPNALCLEPLHNFQQPQDAFALVTLPRHLEA